MSGCEESQETSLLTCHHPWTATTSSFSSMDPRRKRTILLGVLTGVTVVAMLAAVCAIVAVYSSNSGTSSSDQATTTSTAAQRHLVCVHHLHTLIYAISIIYGFSLRYVC